MTSTSADKDASILIVGAGTFGLSTAFHLVERGYKDVTCMDRWAVPSKSSAGWDISKRVQAWYPSTPTPFIPVSLTNPSTHGET
ncbi:hypothetical protein OE88DRAFT_1656378 [Heliocybe sulcata]|uniref:FAD dependent oxidoreductase domain-containing protein n=1 Tax=Heliocybe sulcata TaxID=5364 RepID=A0A5C3N4S0_9AGAM|nr:hypothetical protein OE88DRAFT_1656378 [Heliocybe sulcata]